MNARRANPPAVKPYDALQMCIDAAGKDAKPLVDNLSNFFSEAFETYVGPDDPLMVRALNYIDDKGNYRLPNQFELTTLATEDRRYATTSRAINESVNLAQALKSQLQLG